MIVYKRESEDDNKMNQAVTLNLHSTVFNGVRRDPKSPALKVFNKTVRANHHSESINEKGLYPSQFERQLCPSDGLIYRLSPKIQGVNGVKMLICVTLYNQNSTLLERTLDGIYSNLNNLKEMSGVESRQIAVVVLQDGILKMLQPTKSSKGGKKQSQKPRQMNSCVQFWGEFAQNNGYAYNPLEERINQICDEMDYYGKEGIGGQINENDGLPKTIHKRLALNIQGYYHPKSQRGKRRLEQGLQVMTCFKHLNAKKLSSHLWFLQGFCKTINPKYFVLLDCGTKPEPMGLVNYYIAMETDSQIGGCGGFMRADQAQKQADNDKAREQREERQQQIQKYQRNREKQAPAFSCTNGPIQNFNVLVDKFQNGLIYTGYKLFDAVSLVNAQQLEYNDAHILDKNFQSYFGFLQVLPGAWSAYRYKALCEQSSEEQNIIEEYLKLVLDATYKPKSINQENMYLAEDRILCLAIYTLKNNNYKLAYIPNALASTDPPESIIQLMNQRRRWINSSNAAFDQVARNYHIRVRESSHSFLQKEVFMPLLILFSKLNNFNTYLTPAFFLFAILNSMQSVTNSFYCDALINHNQKIEMLYSARSISMSARNLNITVDKLQANINKLASTNSSYTRQQILGFFNFNLTADDNILNIQKLIDSVSNEYNNIKSQSNWLAIIPYVVSLIYIVLVITLAVTVLNSKVGKDKIGVERKYKAISSALGIFYTLLSLFVFAFVIVRFLPEKLTNFSNCTTKKEKQDMPQISFLGTQYPLTFFIMVCLTLLYTIANNLPRFLHIFTHPNVFYEVLRGMFAGQFHQGLYTHTFVMYSLCNIDDISWGTKNLSSSSQPAKNDQRKENYMKYKLQSVRNYLLYNMLVCFLLIFASQFATNNFVLLALGVYGTIPLVFKSFFAIVHHIKFYMTWCCRARHISHDLQKQRSSGGTDLDQR